MIEKGIEVAYERFVLGAAVVFLALLRATKVHSTVRVYDLAV
jgi:hypothetical protein